MPNFEESQVLKELQIKSLQDKILMHSLCAKLVFHEELKDIPIEKIKDLRPDLRKKVKSIEFSQQFGGGAKAVANSMGCSIQEANKIVKAYKDGCKGIAK